ncbi:MafI family immunity protein [Croceimicrobium hydrocarbonivorans]|uniref:MafI family immunity protein n=1 Tax=Croceimicrobium hydrocarbonivorans TaxID=2761580 RepID=A0A7H0VHF6_9FLAO|nr:MafI family immunity protein [Croceimicrobium hydrocarbonivorans]QNR25154.1 MafI family immunity protein [Croceimicrobium hydrocarbonivorans]
MLKLFRRNNPNQKIQEWSERLISLINKNEALKTQIDSAGIIEGPRIIKEFIEHNEPGLACEHLIYMISESGIYLREEEIDEISQLAKKFGLSISALSKPSEIETEAFYDLLESFNKAQEKVVLNLKSLWGMKTPMPCTLWVLWSRNQYEIDKFKNDQNLRIFPHGFGLSYQDDEVYIDFDFGEQGEYKGFDLYRLWLFLESNKMKTVFTNKNQIKKVIDFETTSGALEFSGYINYYKR